MSEQLQVVITGKDGVSRVFTEVGKSAQDAGRKIEDAGRQGEQGFRRVGESAERAKVDVDDLGVAMTAIGTAMAYAGNAAMNQERQFLALERAYGDATDMMAEFADQMQETTQFSDDAARQSALTFSSLTREYGLSLQEVQQLMTVSADLASLYGISLEDASMRIQSAIRGETEAAEYLGLALNQQSIDREGLTLTMSNQEAAQFRLNALLDQAAYAQGSAGDMAETSAGQYRQLVNELQDAAQWAGDFIGPLGSMVGGLGLAVGGVGNLTGAMGKLGGVVRTLLPGLATIATNPIFLGGAAIAGGVILWNKLSDTWNKAERDQEALSESTRNLTETLNEMRTVQGQLAAADRFELAIQGWDTALEDFNQRMEEARAQYAQGVVPDWWLELAKQEPNFGGNMALALQTVIDQLEVTEAEATRVQDALGALQPLFTNTAIDQQRLNTEIQALFDEFERTGDIDALEAGLKGLNENSQDLLLTTNQLATSLAGLQAEIDKLTFMGNLDLARDVEQLGNLQTAVQDVLGVLSEGEAQAYNEAWEAIWDGVRSGELDADAVIAKLGELDELLASKQITPRQYAAAVVELGLSLDDYAVSTDNATTTTWQFDGALERLAETSDAATEAVTAAGSAAGAFAIEAGAAAAAADEAATAMGTAFGEATATRMEEHRDLIAEMAAGMLELSDNADLLSQWNATELAGDASRLAEGIRETGAALDDTYRVIVGNTNALGSQLQGLKDWSDDLIGDPGVWAEIDDLYNEGRISLEKYTEAQEAQIQITEANATAQRDLLAIQAAQAPIMGDLAERQADYIRQLREMNDGIDDAEDGAQRQLAALGMMDDAMLGQVQQFTEMVGLYQNLGPQGADSMQMLIDSIVATDPVLTAMLEQMGLIVEVADGQYALNLDASGAISDIDQLNQTVGDLIDFLDDGRLNGSYTPNVDIEVTGREEAEGAKQDLEDLAALGAQDLMIDIATRLQTPGEGGEDPLGPLKVWVQGNPVEVPFKLSYAADAGQDAGGAAAAALGGGEGGWGDITVTVTADTSQADESIGATNRSLGDLDESSANVVITGDESEAMESIGAVGYNLATLNGATATVFIEATDNATAVIQDVGSSLGGLDAASATVMMYGNADDAYADISDLQTYNGTVLATSYVDIVTRFSSIGSPTAMSGGIIDEYASGGYVAARLGEAGGELLHLASGGYAYAPGDGLYMTPLGSYVSPAPSSPDGYGGISVSVTVQGNVYGVDDLIEATTRAVAPALAEVATKAFREQGVML